MVNLAETMFRPRTYGMKKATWTNGKRNISGWWEYRWSSDDFLIILDVKDRITGASHKTLTTKNDQPEWGKYKVVK